MTAERGMADPAGLGAYHGLNPAMGWLFAVSRGIQERSRRRPRVAPAVAVGHEASIALVALLVAGLSIVADASAIRIGAAVALLAFGIFRFARPRAHFRWTSMRVSRRGWRCGRSSCPPPMAPA